MPRSLTTGVNAPGYNWSGFSTRSDIRHKVRDFTSWKASYDQHAAARSEAGLKELHRLRVAADPNDVILLFQVEDLASARAFAQSDDLKKAMEDAGVIGTPEIVELQ